MTDQPTAAVPIPGYVQTFIEALAQKGLTACATALTGYGVIASTQQAQVVSLGLSVVLWAASFAWTHLATVAHVGLFNATPSK